MALGYRTRKRLAIFILLVGLPAYLALAWWLTSLLPERPPLFVELAVYVGLGVAWALPLRFIFLGVGKPDPDAPPVPGDSEGGPGTGGEPGRR